ncbi:MAG: cyclic pyranopterin monophosphate synthase MoaC [Candidatus Nezhaarchaeota archaeon]|nr:cyclic pyranopterin monophosphate synthase MoaC [Candidatus Nezhaarchaeota archaeon]MCX8142086.1 cyclic pyranopterin monophosphate synthase MoaC [Candidatus Nezhaarchaeota archaeon]MDW8050133.1 cyclic pyranopterin monophosphate synthase MoaC [Nitrososphaerota archaeon]
MVDITHKNDVYREAEAEGFIKLGPKTLEIIREGKIEKGDVFSVSSAAAILAAKRTSDLLPLCHPLPLTNVSIKFDIEDDGIRVKAKAKTVSKTGVEMEALVAVSIALLNVWDMVKKYEKDENGQYPHTEITNIKVKSKVKGDLNEQDNS